MSAPWGEGHRREARIRWREVANALDAEGDSTWASDAARTWSDTEHDFREAMRQSRRDPDREVRRVRALAEGGLVREDGYRVGLRETDDYSEAQDWSQETGLRLVRVTRIRRAP